MSHPLAVLPALVAFLALLPAGCAATSAVAGPRDEADFVFVYLKTGPRSAGKTAEERKTIFEGHMANILRLAEARKLIIAGPFGDGAHDSSLRGIFVFDVPTVAEARALTETDPGVQSGVFTLECFPLRASPVLRQGYDLDRADRQAAARAGQPSGMGDNIRGYVMLTASDAAQAEAALRDVAAQGKLIWSGRFGGELQGHGVYVLDAADVAAAKELLGPALARVGDCWIDPWWASKALAKLPAASLP